MISPVSRAIAIETSGRIGSIAIVDGGAVLAEESFAHGLQHAAGVIPMIDRLVRGQGWTPADLDELYVSVGPGSFTGLRIAVTLAKTFAFATGAKVVAVPSVRVLVENAPHEARHVVIVLDAKRDQIFTARFDRSSESDGWVATEPARLDSLTNMLARAARPVHLLGEGVPHHRKFIPAEDASVVVTNEDAWRARAAVVAKIGYRMARAGEFANADLLSPVYIRKPEAEEKWDKARAAEQP